LFTHPCYATAAEFGAPADAPAAYQLYVAVKTPLALAILI